MNDYKKEFVKLFLATARYHHRYKVWSDFVKMSAIALYNGITKDPELEQEYLDIAAQYKSEELLDFAKLLGIVTCCLESGFQDFLGALYMDLELGNSQTGQFFTPYSLSKCMAQLVVDPEIKPGRVIKLHEPAAGSGGCVIAVADVLQERGVKVHEKLFVSCVELDATVAYMCFIQLALYGISAEIIIGNSLTLQFQRTLRTPVYFLEQWESRLFADKALELLSKLDSNSDKEFIPLPPSSVKSESDLNILEVNPNAIKRDLSEQLTLC